MKKNWWTEEGKAVTKYKDLAQFVQKINKTVEGPENQSHKLSAQGWIIKQTRNISPPPPWIHFKFSNTVRFVYILCYNWHWKTLSYSGRPRNNSRRAGTKRRFYERKNFCSCDKHFHENCFNFQWPYFTHCLHWEH